MFHLRPYQSDARLSLRHHFANSKKKVILCLPTGAGKTVIFSYLVAETIKRNPKARILILVDRIELLAQAGGTLAKFGIDWSPISAGAEVEHHASVYVGMVETFYKRIAKFPHLLDLNLVIIDEAHRGNFKKLFPHFRPHTFVIGATATPIAAGKKDPLNKLYDDIVVPISISGLIESGYLVPAETYAAKTDTSKLKVDKTGEYSVESQLDVFAKRSVYDGVVNKYIQLSTQGGKPEKAICFNVNIEHSIEVCRRFLEAGIMAEHLDGETPSDQRAAILKRFQTGETMVLCNVGIVTTGYDEPSVTTIIVNRATTSVPLWLQMCGRGARLYEGKASFKIIDMGDNWRALGLWEDERDWVDIFNNPIKAKKKKNAPPAPVKDCPNCEAIVPLSAKICPYCQYNFPVEVREVVLAEEVEFDLISSVKPKDWGGLSVPDLAKVQLIKGYKLGWVLHQLKDRAKGDLDAHKQLLSEFAAVRGYKRGWVDRQLEGFATN